jgi:hypothetical protein
VDAPQFPAGKPLTYQRAPPATVSRRLERLPAALYKASASPRLLADVIHRPTAGREKDLRRHRWFFDVARVKVTGEFITMI